MTPFFPGRFQPFHNGHLMVIKGMMKIHGNAVVVICHGPKMGEDDILSAEEVQESISSALLDAELMDATITLVKDESEDAKWADAVIASTEHAPDPIVWTGNEDVAVLFEKKGIPVKRVKPVPGITGKELRDMIMDGHPGWKSKVPDGVVEVIGRKKRT